MNLELINIPITVSKEGGIVDSAETEAEDLSYKFTGLDSKHGI